MSTDRSRRGLTDDDASSPPTSTLAVAPLDDATLDALATLGVTPQVTDRELRRAYRRALLAAHPDQGGSREALDLVRSAHEHLRSLVRPVAGNDAEPGTATRPTHERTETDATPAVEFVEPATLRPTGQPVGLVEAAAPTPVRADRAARAAAKFVTAQRFATAGSPRPAGGAPRRRATGRRRSRFEQLLERELVRRSDRRVRLASGADVGAGR